MVKAVGESETGLLRFFGLETGEKALKTLLWSLPYLLALGAGLGGLSYLVSRFLHLPGWVYAVAIVLSLLYFFLFLARVGELAHRAEDHRDEGPGTGC